MNFKYLFFFIAIVLSILANSQTTKKRLHIHFFLGISNIYSYCKRRRSVNTMSYDSLNPSMHTAHTAHIPFNFVISIIKYKFAINQR